ncbi:Imm44 family immunity protein [Mucilaginibacter sp. UC70_90]
MDFGLAITVSVEIRNKTHYIHSLSDELKTYFENKQYGNDIKSYTIGILCVSPQFDQFYKKEIKPKYTKGVKVIKPDGIPFTLEDSFEYRIKIDFETFKNADEEEARKLLAKEILASLVVFEKMKSKIKDFDMNRFKADLEEYFKTHNLILI